MWTQMPPPSPNSSLQLKSVQMSYLAPGFRLPCRTWGPSSESCLYGWDPDSLQNPPFFRGWTLYSWAWHWLRSNSNWSISPGTKIIICLIFSNTDKAWKITIFAPPLLSYPPDGTLDREVSHSILVRLCSISDTSQRNYIVTSVWGWEVKKKKL